MKLKPVSPVKSLTLTADHYWKLRALLKDFAALPGEMQALLQKQQEETQQRIHAEMTAAGLDPAVNYQLSDRDLTATPQ